MMMMMMEWWKWA